MQVIETTVYTFDELPTEQAKQAACDWWRTFGEPFWSDESLESIQTFCNHFGVTLKSWEVSAYSSPYFSTDATNEHFRGRKLSDFKRDYMPTGYCLDWDLWSTFYDVFKRTGDAKSAFLEALWEGFRAWRNDIESQDTNPYIGEHLEINGYTFTEDGKRFG